MGHPFHEKAFSFSQPDGSVVEVIGWGNDTYAIFETPDGYTIYRDPKSGAYSFAAINPVTGEFEATDLVVGVDDPEAAGIEKHLRERRDVVRRQIKARTGEGSDWRRRASLGIKRASLELMETGAVESLQREFFAISGRIVGLCIPIDFADEPSVFSQEDVHAFCNQRGYTGHGNNGSVRDYFYDISGGRLIYENLVLPVYRAKELKTYYTDPLVGGASRTIELIKEAIAYYIDEEFDFSELTTSQEGTVYALNVFYSGENNNAYRQGLWPHQWYLDSPIDIGGALVKDYQITNMGNALTLGTFCHESGHLICGFPDLYDTDEGSAGVGVYCVMGYGGVIDEKNPAEPCGFLKYRAGWFSSALAIENGQEYMFFAGENSLGFYTRNATEYLLIEHRSATGRDQSLPSSGLAVWHVDTEMETNDWEYGEEDKHFLCALIQADGRYNLESNENTGDGYDLFGSNESREYPNTGVGMSSRWWDGTPTGVSLKDIRSDDQVTVFTALIDPS